MRIKFPVLSLCLLLVVANSEIIASPGSVLVKSITSQLSRKGGAEAAEKLSQEAGEVLVERVAVKVVRDGGKESLDRLAVLTAQHGPDVLRALDNSPSATRMLTILEELPVEQVPAALARLSAGASGRDLSEATIRWGSSALRSELAHPGVGGRLVHVLGSDGVELCSHLTTDQAIAVARHADDIAALPPSLRSSLLEVIVAQPDRFARFVGRFVENNPKVSLFTGATTAVFLKNSERLFGGDEIVIGPDGVPQVISKRGTIERTFEPVIQELSFGVRMLWIACIVVSAVSILSISILWIGRLWHGWRSLIQRKK